MKKIVLLGALGLGCWACVAAQENAKPEAVEHGVVAVSEKDLHEAAAVLASLTPAEQDALKQLLYKELQMVSPTDVELAVQKLKVELEEKMQEHVANKRGYLGIQFAAIIAATGLLVWLISPC